MGEKLIPQIRFGLGRNVLPLLVRLAETDLIATFRCTLDLQLRIDQLHHATGYSRSKVIRKLIDGGLRALEQQDTVNGIVTALNRLSKMR
jgi:predicted DNA-binding protein